MTGWARFEQENAAEATTKINGILKHLNELASITSLTEERQSRYLRFRSANVTRADEVDTTTYVNLPSKRNPKFYGREEQIQTIDEYLNPQTAVNLRTFTIYGRRGVGKTNIALEYAHRNPSKFGAVFWIRCETSSSLRISFLEMALMLKLGGVNSETHHEEVLMLCQKWLERTDKYWLLIFDNAEDEDLLRIYWPASKGAIIITSRKWVNFSNHAVRKGHTIQPFDYNDGWELFIRCVGWDKKLQRHEIPPDEIAAAEELVREFEGLPLSIDQAASLLTSGRFATTRELLSAFQKAQKTVERRPTHTHSKTNHAIDSIWHVVFQSLGDNARGLLSILCLLSPDITYVDVFQPKDQSMLTPFSEFCRRDPGTTIQSSASLQEAISQLMNGALITRKGRILTIHRVVQEAFFYVNKSDHAAAFEAGALLIYEAFPQQVNGRPLHSQWERCERFIHEAISLCQKYREFQRNGEEIRAPPQFRLLLKSCAWFLFEVGDYNEIFPLLSLAYEIGGDDTSSLAYADLRNTSGGCYFELNQLHDCRTAWEETLEIRTRLLPPGAEDLANIINNMGNLESAEGNYDKALQLFDRARIMRMDLGDDGRASVTLTLMGIGRTYEWKGQFEEAAAKYEEAESLVLQTAGENNMYMASVFYAQGNLERALKDGHAARARYDQALKVLNKIAPTHLLVSCAHFKIACVERELGDLPQARRHLEAAREIGELRRRDEDDGHIARILWKRAEILGSEMWEWSSRQNEPEIAAIREQAEQMRGRLERRDSVVTLPEVVDESVYDRLVCGYFR